MAARLPVSVEAPVLLFSGTLDPVTGPRWGERAAAHLPNSLHLVVPGAHGVDGVRAVLRLEVVDHVARGLPGGLVDGRRPT